MWPGVPPELFTLVACLSGSQGTVELPEGPEHDATCSQQTPGPGSEPCRENGLQDRQELMQPGEGQDLQPDFTWMPGNEGG